MPRSVVIIDDISRLARDLMGYLTLREEIAAAGSELKSPKMEFLTIRRRNYTRK